MTPPIAHIFDKSSCLGSRQLNAYMTGAMSREEQHAAEHHINNCALCSGAIDGLELRSGAEAVQIASLLNDNFLRSYISTVRPHHQAPPTEVITPAKRKVRIPHSSNTAGTFAPLLSAVFILFAYLAWQRPDLTVGRPVAVKVQKASTVAEAVVIPVPRKTEEKTEADEEKLLAAIETEERPAQLQDHIDTRVKPVSIRAAGVLSRPDDIVKKLAEKAAEPEVVAQVKAKDSTPRQVVPPSSPAIARVEPVKTADNNGGEKGMEQFESENWQGALSSFRKEMNKGDTEHRQEATLMAAKSLQKLGKTEEAKQLLSAVADSEGPKHRAAKRMLRRISNGDE